MGNSVPTMDVKFGQKRDIADYDQFLSDEQVAAAVTYPTDLRALTPESFDRIARHGFKVTGMTFAAYGNAVQDWSIR